jgi:nanoRNase/pAp phosphatase (c-di-AMP/oligoRNAs hydrolase)
MWFDHHSSESERLGEFEFEGAVDVADSAARVIYEYYGGKEKHPHFETMVCAVDKVDSAKLTADEILKPEGWVLLGFIMDPRTGLGRFRNFRISNYELMEALIDECAVEDIDQILANPDVQERVEMYFDQDAQFKTMLSEHTRTDGNVIVIDLRGVDPIYTGNRFLVYSLFPEQNISMQVVDGRDKKNCPIMVGHSIINRSCKTDVGALMLKYGGGGHFKVGTCQVPYDEADDVIKKFVEIMKADESK